MADFYDIDLAFGLDSRGDIALVEDDGAIKQSIRNHLLTATGKKPGFGSVNPNFGVGIENFLFAPLTEFTAQVFAERILNQLDAFETRINVENVSVVSDLQEKAFRITIIYRIINNPATQTFRTVINQI